MVRDQPVVPNIKDINFWEQFTTFDCVLFKPAMLFRISKISTFESNSQQPLISSPLSICCSEYQRYQLLRAIHNAYKEAPGRPGVVPNIKDINFWEQFTTSWDLKTLMDELFRISKISTFESNSQLLVVACRNRLCCSEYQRYQLLRAIHNS